MKLFAKFTVTTMRVHLIKKQSIVDFVAENSQSKSAFQNWLSIIRHADWEKPADILDTFVFSDILGKG